MPTMQGAMRKARPRTTLGYIETFEHPVGFGIFWHRGAWYVQGPGLPDCGIAFADQAQAERELGRTLSTYSVPRAIAALFPGETLAAYDAHAAVDANETAIF